MAGEAVIEAVRVPNVVDDKARETIVRELAAGCVEGTGPTAKVQLRSRHKRAPLVIR
jgi:hypothetical protein